jgi:hypothetical protein
VNSHDVTVLGYLAVLVAGIVLQLLATRTRAPIPPLGKVFAWAMSTRTRRVGLLVAWAWVGLHFFARLSRSGEPGPRHSAGITDDGHRKNILSSAFHHIGIAIFRDRHGTVWLTQDFSN